MKEFIEKLVGRLEELRKEYYEDYNAYKIERDLGNVDGLKHAISIVNELAEEYSANTPQKSAGGWIPVTERLPENKTNVLICCGEFVYYALFEYGHFSNDYGLWYKSVTHWQPLPAPYRMEKSENAEWKEAVMNHFTKIE